ncbi:hypothetical protein BAUCODRAFT_36871 [Baudoinia panamericana UAMH 10762]|uniref:PWI domain-containing protein n=1 Tax=Baudoinia panamericana (strain UAMH 10762) TaxID=717646 RepID=M2MP06_BAUPA|nr:uncharacterized protein BAUCODRAFT_36871 [Baudoinia panamericana UAMH 10762]EMC93203.1 hypothetical protein BAUCODRAFT_36871 [Baudoinia panamericana UAMH 10762]
MAYYGPPGGYPSQPPYSQTPFGVPPGMAQSPTGMPSQFQPPPNMPPGFNPTAPVIHFGMDRAPQVDDMRGGGRGGRLEGRGSNAEPLGGRSRLGLGARDDRGAGRGGDIDERRAAVRESMMALQPPTREEVARTIFIGGLGDGTPGDEHIESILGCAGKLRRWTRVRDADDRKCKFGFAEYEDVDSLEAANEIFGGGVEVPVMKNGVAEKDDSGEVKTTKLLVVVDDQSKEYISEWKGRRKEDPDARQFRIDGCREDMRQCIASLSNLGAFAANAEATNGRHDANGDIHMQNGDSIVANADSVTIPVSQEDELSDIPVEMRPTIAAEIRSFRNRSHQKDIEKLRHEEELETLQRQRSAPVSRLARDSPPPGGANGVPVGPRSQIGVQGAPVGPKGFRGTQLPSDYTNGVAFVGPNGATNGSARDADEDAEESDSELERRRQAKKDEELHRAYLDAERRWTHRERTRTAAHQREKQREEEEKRAVEYQREALERRLREWDDDVEAREGREEYYHDRGAWLRKRAVWREREGREDERDRVLEEREAAEERRREAEARGGVAGDGLVERSGDEKAGQPTAGAAAGFKISLGSAAKSRALPATATATGPGGVGVKRGLADVEGLLEDEEDAALASGSGGRKKIMSLKPLTDLSTVPAPGDMTDEERTRLRTALAREIPTETDELFATPLNYRYLTPKVLEEQIRPLVVKRVVDYLGVQEDMLVDVVVSGLDGKRGAREIVEEVEPVMGREEAEGLVRKVWRVAVFWGEAGGRGLL